MSTSKGASKKVVINKSITGILRPGRPAVPKVNRLIPRPGDMESVAVVQESWREGALDTMSRFRQRPHKSHVGGIQVGGNNLRDAE